MKNTVQNWGGRAEDKNTAAGNKKNSKTPEKYSAFKKFLERLDKAFKENCST